MDALSDVLKALRISGGIFLDAEFTAPWCVASRVGPEDFRNDDELPPSVVAFHYVIDGQMVVEVEGAPPVIVRAGEIVLLPRNNPHLLTSQELGDLAGLPPRNSGECPQARRKLGSPRRQCSPHLSAFSDAFPGPPPLNASWEMGQKPLDLCPRDHFTNALR